jgi:putative alpha-1,2-mannosidase
MDLPVTRQIGNASVNPDTGRITATGGFTPSFGQGGYVLHSCVDFRGAKIRGTGVFQDKETSTANKSVKIDYNHYGRSAGAFVRFNAPPSNRILVRVGVSFMSVDQACRNAERELADFEFDKTVKLAEDAWRDKLSVIKVDAGGVHRDMEVIFWSGIYRSMLSPQDYTGENPLWQSDEPYYDSFYW